MVIDALPAMADRDVYYLICGQGELREELLRYADSLGVRERVRMPGFVEDLRWIYWNADIFVFPSFREGMPVALMEAMAAGLPCVASEIRGCRELLNQNSRCRKTSMGMFMGMSMGTSVDTPIGTSLGKSRQQALCQVPGGFRFSLKQPEQLLQALKMLADQKSLRQACGTYNERRIKNFGRDRVQKKMKEIYTGMAVTGHGGR